MKKGYYSIVFIVLFLLCFQSSCKRTGNAVGITLTDYTIEHQRKIGGAITGEILSNISFKALAETDYSSAYYYLNTLLNTLLTRDIVDRRDKLDWEIIVLHDDSRRSIFTAPGGKIFIYTGFLRFIHSENQLLCVLAHEIYYANTDTGIDRLATQIDRAGSVFGDITLGNEVDMEGIVSTLENLSFSIDEIMEADNFSIDLLCVFQYDANGLKHLLLEADALSMPIQWTITRPYSSNRVENIMEQAAICGMDEDLQEVRYQEFLNEDLP